MTIAFASYGRKFIINDIFEDLHNTKVKTKYTYNILSLILVLVLVWKLRLI